MAEVEVKNAKINVAFKTAEKLERLTSGESLNDSLGKVDKAIAVLSEMQDGSSGNNVGSSDILPVGEYFVQFCDELLDGCEFIADEVTDYSTEHYETYGRALSYDNNGVLTKDGTKLNDRFLFFNNDQNTSISGWSGPISIFKKAANKGYKMARIIVGVSSHKFQIGGSLYAPSTLPSALYTADIVMYSQKNKDESNRIVQLASRDAVSTITELDLTTFLDDVFVHVDISSGTLSGSNQGGVCVAFGGMLLY